MRYARVKASSASLRDLAVTVFPESESCLGTFRARTVPPVSDRLSVFWLFKEDMSVGYFRAKTNVFDGVRSTSKYATRRDRQRQIGPNALIRIPPRCRAFAARERRSLQVLSLYRYALEAFLCDLLYFRYLTSPSPSLSSFYLVFGNDINFSFLFCLIIQEDYVNT